MDASIEKLATFQHARVVYTPFAAPPGAQFVLTADPWSFLTATINQKLSAHPRGANRERLERALYYTDLAESFYAAAKEIGLPAKGTLAYYGILNLVKAYLSISGVDLETSVEHHGLSLVQGEKQKIQIASPAANVINIFHEFARLLGKPVTGRSALSLEELSGHIPEIHEMAFTLGHLPGSKRGFLLVDIRFLMSNSDSHIYTEIAYEKKQLNRVDISKFLRGPRKAYFQSDKDLGAELVHRSQRRKTFEWGHVPRKYSNICREYAAFDLASILTPDGYRYYCDLRSPTLHHLSYSLILMFYVGTAARYRPSEMVELLASDKRPLVAEALAVIPGQMLYHLISLCTGRNCVVPHSAIAS